MGVRIDGGGERLFLVDDAGRRLQGTQALVDIHNQGQPIAPDMLERIFEYGVSEAPDAAALGQRGQGLFVARTYMAKMGGTVSAANADGGVVFRLVLQRATR